MLQLLRLLVHRVTGWLGSNQLLLLLLGSNWNLLQRRTMMVHARAGPNHGRTLGSDRLATVVTSTRPSLPVHNSPIRICCSRKSNRLFLSFATQEIIENTKKKKEKREKKTLFVSCELRSVCTCSHVNAPQNGSQSNSDDKRGQGDAHRYFSWNAHENHLLRAGHSVVLTRRDERTGRCCYVSRRTDF